MENKKIFVGVCVEGPQEYEVISKNFITALIQRWEDRKKINETNLGIGYIVPNNVSDDQIEIILSYYFKKHFKEMKNVKGNRIKDKVSMRNDEAVDFVGLELSHELKKMGFVILNKNEKVDKKYYYSNAKTAQNKKYVDNFKSWYNKNVDETIAEEIITGLKCQEAVRRSYENEV